MELYWRRAAGIAVARQGYGCKVPETDWNGGVGNLRVSRSLIRTPLVVCILLTACAEVAVELCLEEEKEHVVLALLS
jgi:hypothetical protein